MILCIASLLEFTRWCVSRARSAALLNESQNVRRGIAVLAHQVPSIRRESNSARAIQLPVAQLLARRVAQEDIPAAITHYQLAPIRGEVDRTHGALIITKR